jgi:hypothetical protein
LVEHLKAYVEFFNDDLDEESDEDLDEESDEKFDEEVFP